MESDSVEINFYVLERHRKSLFVIVKATAGHQFCLVSREKTLLFDGTMPSQI